MVGGFEVEEVDKTVRNYLAKVWDTGDEMGDLSQMADGDTRKKKGVCNYTSLHVPGVSEQLRRHLKD